MIVNNVNINTYNAVLLSKDIQTSNVTIYDEWLVNAMNPLYMGKNEQYKQIKIKIFVKDNSDENALDDISNLIRQLEKCTLKFDDLDFYYDCVITSKSHERNSRGIYTLNIELKSGYAYKQPVNVSFSGKTKIFNVDGNMQTPAVVSISVPIDTISVTLSGMGDDPIVIKNMKKDTPVLIDGELCMITENGTNKFGDCDIWEFPKLNAGTNTVQTDNDKVQVSISYKPRWM